MRPVPEAEFSAWAQSHGITRSRRWPHALGLVFATPAVPPGGDYESWWGTWPQPEDDADVPEFVRQLLDVAGAARVPLYLRAHRGWPSVPEAEQGLTDWPPAVARLLAHSGVPLPWGGALRFEPEERAVVEQVLAGCLVARSFNHVDVIPGDGRCVLATCHDGEVHGDFPSEAARDAFDARLREAGYREDES